MSKPSPNQHRTEVLFKAGLKTRKFVVKGETLYLIEQARFPIYDTEILSIIGKWYNEHELDGLISRLEDASALRRYEQQAERAEQRQEFLKRRYWY